jgi:hypothetical protein
MSIDYVLFHTPAWSFAVFNLADVFISVGAASPSAGHPRRVPVSDPSEYRRFVVLEEALAVEERTPATWIALAAGWSEAPGAANGHAQTNSRVARALNTGILAGLARVALADRAPALAEFVAMGMQLAEFEASRFT